MSYLLFIALAAIRTGGYLTPQDTLAVAAVWTHDVGERATVAVLSRGRILVVDPGEPGVHMLPADLAHAEKIGRSGAGPGEYREPSSAFRYQGDSALVWDNQLRRFLLIDPAGRAAGDVAPPPEVPLVLPISVDSLGYVLLLRRGPEPGTAWVVRWGPLRSPRNLDTVAQIRRPPETSVTRTRGSIVSTFRLRVPYTAGDQVLAGPAGISGILRVGYYLDEHTAGRWTTHPVVPHQRVPVVAADVKAVTLEDRGRPWEGADRHLPETKSPFVEEGVILSSNGMLWVHLSQPATLPGERYDVLDLRGRRLRTVHVPSGVRVLAVDKFVYGLKCDDGGCHILAYRMPSS